MFGYKGATEALNANMAQLDDINHLINESQVACPEQLLIDRHMFFVLCGLLRTVGQLNDLRHVMLKEKEAMFFHVLAHHDKNRVIKLRFLRLGETVSRHFNAVLKIVLRLQGHLLLTPEPILKTCNNDR